MALESVKSPVNEEAIRYQARTVLANLANEIAARRVINWDKVKKAAKIRYWLKALDYKEFLTLTQRNQIWYKLIEISGINNFPTSPILEERTRPNILTGIQGPPGDDAAGGGGSGGTFFQNTDVGTPSEVVDSFAVTLARGASWNYTVRDALDTKQRTGWISAGWLADNTINSGGEYSIAEIGDTSGVALSVDINSGNVRLIATVSANNFIVEGRRYLTT